tara:strand:+ start:92 stop:952 length:861 start_codon:yes stop_codon:yes gene_type:complete
MTKFIDLFSGMGSFHYSFKRLGWKCVMASDIEKTARDTYKQNYNIEPLGDITKIEPKDIPHYDILCAGFPCQPFSQCGHGKGFEDERGTMFSQVMKFVKFHSPKIVVLENVKALLNHNKGKSFDKIKTDLENENYTVLHKVLTCSDYGIPQMRKRLFIIAYKEITLPTTFFDNLNTHKNNTTLKNFLNKNFQKDTAYTIRCGGRNSPINDRHNWDGYLVDNKEYRLTIEDALKLQGFDENYKLTGTVAQKWKQLGNTIPTIFTNIIGTELAKFIPNPQCHLEREKH